MKNENEQLEALQEIRKMMKDSSKFLSLSGLSGVFAGVYALAGAYFGHLLIAQYHLASGAPAAYSNGLGQSYPGLLMKLILICGGVLFLSVGTAFLMTHKKAKKTNEKLFDHTSKKLLWNMIVPLACGGLFCFALLLNNDVAYIGPTMLLFYGMALINASKYTMSDIRYLGYFELVLGLLSAFFSGYGLFFWAFGFGLMHIIYGSIMWFKYDRHS